MSLSTITRSIRTPTIDRRGFLVGAIAAGAVAATPASADAAAEAFVSEALAEVNANADADPKTRAAVVDRLVAEYVDMRRIGRYVLGPYARVITDAQRATYRPLFREFARRIYTKLLLQYSGERILVTGSRDRRANDIIVDSRFVDASPGDPFANVTFNWRVYRDRAGAMSVVDAGADDVFLAIEQQSQFKSVIANNGGGTRGIDALIEELRTRLNA
ncbi:MAG: ABC transporter substrate-binding protein [Pseudomonadota bacterium]